MSTFDEKRPNKTTPKRTKHDDKFLPYHGGVIGGHFTNF